MKTEKDIFWETIEIFEKEGILSHLILVGSWVEVIYETTYFPRFEASLRTRDIDFLIKNIRLPREKIDIVKILEEHGFVSDTDPMTGVTKFYKDGILELQFLVKQLGTGQVEPYQVASMGIKAEGLRNMNILADYTTTVYAKGHQITVPQPTAYILEKLIIHNQRGAKREKDIRAVQRILDVIQQSKKEKKTLKDIYDNLSVKQKRTINKICEEFGIILF